MLGGSRSLTCFDRLARFIEISSDEEICKPFWNPILAWALITAATVLELLALPLLVFWKPLDILGFPLPIHPRILLCAALSSVALGLKGLAMIDARTGFRRASYRLLLVITKTALLICVFFIALIYVWNNNQLFPVEAFPTWMGFSALLALCVTLAIMLTFYRTVKPLLRDVIGILLIVTSTGFFVLSGYIAPIDWALVSIGETDGFIFLVSIFAIVALPIVFAVGIIIQLPSKKLVLFLRKFGYEELNATIRETIQQKLGADYRLVTLDDASFKFLGTPLRDRVVAFCGFALITIILVSSMFGLGWLIDRLTTANTMPGDIKELGSGAIGGIEGWMYDIFLNGLKQGLTFVAFWYLLVLIVMLTACLLIRGRARYIVRSANALNSVQSKLRKLSLRRKSPSFLGSQAVVVSVIDQFWQQAVSSILQISHSVIVDISTPSDSIKWELTQIQSDFAGSVLLLARRDAISDWLDDVTVSRDLIIGEALPGIEGHEILVYDDPNAININKLAEILNRP